MSRGRTIARSVLLGLFALMMAGSGAGYLSGSAAMVEGFAHLGYPDYFRVLLGVAKIVGALALIVPRVPTMVREWAYAGFVITLVSAAVSHGAVGDGASKIVAPLFALTMLLAARALGPRLAEVREPKALAS